MIINSDILEKIIAHAESEAPIEACGYLMGTDGRVTRDYPMNNIERREDHYKADPEQQFAAFKTARQEGLTIIAAYHSHPATPARPSDEDISLAYDPELIYVIVSLAQAQKTVKAFRIREGVVEEETLAIEAETGE